MRLLSAITARMMGAISADMARRLCFGCLCPERAERAVLLHRWGMRGDQVSAQFAGGGASRWLVSQTQTPEARCQRLARRSPTCLDLTAGRLPGVGFRRSLAPLAALTRRCLALVLLPWPGGSGKVVLRGTGRPASGGPDRPVHGLPHQRADLPAHVPAQPGARHAVRDGGLGHGGGHRDRRLPQLLHPGQQRGARRRGVRPAPRPRGRRRPACRRSPGWPGRRSRQGRGRGRPARCWPGRSRTWCRGSPRRERAAGGDQGPAVGPLDQVGRRRLGQRGRVGHGQDHRPVDVRGHVRDDLLGERARPRRGADQDRRVHPGDDLGQRRSRPGWRPARQPATSAGSRAYRGCASLRPGRSPGQQARRSTAQNRAWSASGHVRSASIAADSWSAMPCPPCPPRRSRPGGRAAVPVALAAASTAARLTAPVPWMSSLKVSSGPGSARAAARRC